MESSGTHSHSSDGQQELTQRSINSARPYPIPLMATSCSNIYKSIFTRDLAGFFVESHKQHLVIDNKVLCYIFVQE